jgi:acylglycerol lipase
MTDIIQFQIVNKKLILNVLTHKIDNPKLILIHLHGLHSSFQFTYDCPEEFHNRVSIFKKGNIVSYGLEFNGHGKSDGKKAYLNNFDSLVEDLNCLVSYVSKYHNNLPIYLLGESLGGSVAIKYSYLHKKKIKGIILLSPLFDFSKNLSYCSTLFLLRLSYIYPSFNLGLILSKGDSSVNEEYNKILKNNQYSYSKRLTLCSVRECYKYCNWWRKNIKKMDIPILTFHCKKDNIASFDATEDFNNLCVNSFNEYISYEGTNHSILVPKNDKDFDPFIILHKIANWILKNKDWEEIKLI